jgi:hypothetical protein
MLCEFIFINLYMHEYTHLCNVTKILSEHTQQDVNIYDCTIKQLFRWIVSYDFPFMAVSTILILSLNNLLALSEDDLVSLSSSEDSFKK